jgi:hypothetical protein
LEQLIAQEEFFEEIVQIIGPLRRFGEEFLD